MKKGDINPFGFDGEIFRFLDQTKLPLEEVYVETGHYERIAEAIERLEVRGAPAIGVCAAYALALALKENDDEELFLRAAERLKRTRPTAVNLFWAIDKMISHYIPGAGDNFHRLKITAEEIHLHEVNNCARIAQHGSALIKSPSNVITHCNTGVLAVAGTGTALGVIKQAFTEGKIKHVYVDETRPLYQGSRLTAFELERAGIPFSVNVDSAAAVIISQGKADLVITGADRIASNGDSANKIGTFNLSVLCKQFNIPFYIAAPTTTIDRSLRAGKEIIIEERDASELRRHRGAEIFPAHYPVYNPAFDVTPAENITAIITEEGVFKYPYDFS
ncbi:MAG: S-methyl-5-thioribose-1-phosphate isomerase [Ignavibacteriaceae bacterium]|nr:S-methyl-5-thioribose-1-phosphate isomerase [Ignavibacteriaceae bacterium]